MADGKAVQEVLAKLLFLEGGTLRYASFKSPEFVAALKEAPAALLRLRPTPAPPTPLCRRCSAASGRQLCQQHARAAPGVPELYRQQPQHQPKQVLQQRHAHPALARQARQVFARRQAAEAAAVATAWGLAAATRATRLAWPARRAEEQRQRAYLAAQLVLQQLAQLQEKQELQPWQQAHAQQQQQQHQPQQLVVPLTHGKRATAARDCMRGSWLLLPALSQTQSLPPLTFLPPTARPPPCLPSTCSGRA